MIKKVVLFVVMAVVVLISIVLVGGPAGGGFLWWGSREPIYIFGDEAFTYENGVIAGSGSTEDPYIIEGWRIDDPRADYGIYIDHTTRHFVIRNCAIERARAAAIYLNCVVNGRIEGAQLTLSETGVYLLNSRENTLAENLLAENRYGVVMAAGSRDNTITGNSFVENGLSGLDSERRNRWYSETTGNYWSDYDGDDLDGDGIGDRPYAPLGDPYPLVSPPVSRISFPPFGRVASEWQLSPEGAIVITSATPIVLSATDPGSGLAAVFFSIDEGEWKTYSGPFTLTGPDGPHQVSYYGVDHLGNVEPVRTLSFLLDNSPPVTTIEIGEPTYRNAVGLWLTSKTPITLRVAAGKEFDEVSTYFKIDSGDFRPYSQPFTITGADGPHMIAYYSRDVLGNTEPTRTMTVIKDDTPPTTRGMGEEIGLIQSEATQSAPTEELTEQPATETQTPSQGSTD